MVDTDEAKLTITAQHEVPEGASFVKVALISAPIIAFVSVFIGAILFFALVIPGIIPAPDPPIRAMLVILLLAAASWVVLYGLFIGKMYYNLRLSSRDLENMESEGEYSFYGNKVVASLEGKERSLAYEDLEYAERRGDEAFGFYPPEGKRRSGVSPIVFGLTEDQQAHQADAFWAQIKPLICATNSDCDFYTMERGSRHADEQGGAAVTHPEALPEPPADVEFTLEPERIERIIDQQPGEAQSEAQVGEDCTLTFHAHETNPDAAEQVGREIVVVGSENLKIQRLEVRGNLPEEAAPAKYWDRCVSIQQKARSGTLALEEEVGQPPGDDLHVGRREEKLRIWERPRIDFGALLVPVVLAGGLIAGGVFGDVLALTIVGAIIGVAAVLLIALRFVGRNELHL
jgi:hypothetical protein